MVILTIFVVELRRQRRRALPYILLLIEMPIVALIHRQLVGGPAGEIEIDPEIYIVRQILAGVPLLMAAALLLALPLIARDSIAGAQEAVLMTGVSEPAYAAGKFAAVLSVVGLLTFALASLSLVACWWHYGQVPAWEAVRMSGVVALPAAILSAAACLFVGSLTRHLMVQILGLALLAAGFAYTAFAVLGLWDSHIPAVLLDPMMGWVWSSIAEMAGPGYYSVQLLQGEGTMDTYEWSQIFVQRAFLLTIALLLTSMAWCVVRIRELDYSRLWKKRGLPFRSTLHRFLFFGGRGPGYWLALIVPAALMFGTAGWFVWTLSARMKMPRSAVQTPPGDVSASANGGATVRAEAMSLDISLGSRTEPLRGTCEYRLVESNATEMRLLLNPGLNVTAAAFDGRGVPFSRNVDIITLGIGSVPAGAHVVKLNFDGFVNNFYRTKFVYEIGRIGHRQAPLYYYIPAAPAVARVTSGHSWLLPDDRWFPIINVSNVSRTVECSITVRAPRGWGVTTPGLTTSVAEDAGRMVHRSRAAFSPSEMECLSVIAEPSSTISRTVGGRPAEIICRDPAAVSANRFSDAFWQAAEFLSEIDPGIGRPVQAVGMNQTLRGDLPAAVTLFQPFVEKGVDLWDLFFMTRLIPTSCLTGAASKHPFFSGGLGGFITVSLRRELFGVAGQHGGGSAVVPRAATSIDRAIVLAEWRGITQSGAAAHVQEGTYGDKASRILSTLSYLLGQEGLTLCVQRFFAEYRFADPSPEDFCRIVDEEAAKAGIDLGWYWDDYFRNAMLPHLGVVPNPVAWRGDDGRYTAVARIENDWNGRMLVPVVIHMDGDLWRGQVFVDGHGDVRASLPARPRRIEIDPDGQVYRADVARAGEFRILDRPPGSR